MIVVVAIALLVVTVLFLIYRAVAIASALSEVRKSNAELSEFLASQRAAEEDETAPETPEAKRPLVIEPGANESFFESLHDGTFARDLQHLSDDQYIYVRAFFDRVDEVLDAETHRRNLDPEQTPAEETFIGACCGGCKNKKDLN